VSFGLERVENSSKLDELLATRWSPVSAKNIDNEHVSWNIAQGDPFALIIQKSQMPDLVADIRSGHADCHLSPLLLELSRQCVQIPAIPFTHSLKVFQTIGLVWSVHAVLGKSP
jgi:hypothetical protein